MILNPLLLLPTLPSLCQALSIAIQQPFSPSNPSLRSILSRNLSVDDILQASSKPRQCVLQDNPEHTSHARLIYVTPWNADGYAYTALHSQRISHVVPVWYQVKVSGAKVSLDGSHNIKQDWLDSLSRNTRVLPRFEIVFASRKELEAIVFFPRDEVADIVEAIATEVNKHAWHGATLEVPYPAQMTSLIKALGMALHANEKELVLVIPAHHRLNEPSPFSRSDALRVLPFIDYFSLNAYDHSSATGQELGNAPLPWLHHILHEMLSADNDDVDDDLFSDAIFADSFTSDAQNIDVELAQKVLLGLNFYGFTYTTDAVMNTITATQYRDLVEFSTISIPLSIEWNQEAGEHRMDGKFWCIWYPTPLSVLMRVHLAKDYGVGISVWEAGQGMDYLWDVLF